MRLPSHTVDAIGQNAREKLAAWLAEREIDRALAEGEVSAPSSGLRYRQTIKPSTTPREGDIVILRPDPNGVWSPVYVVLLEVSRDDGCLAIPFSRYAVPAVPGEWQTSFDAQPLRVLCFWNRREISGSDFISEAAGCCDPEQLQQIRRIHKHVFDGETMDQSNVWQPGPPLIHPADPRYDYLDEERDRLDVHLQWRTPAAFGESPENIIPLDLHQREKARWLMAAEGRPDYGTT